MTTAQNTKPTSTTGHGWHDRKTIDGSIRYIATNGDWWTVQVSLSRSRYTPFTPRGAYLYGPRGGARVFKSEASAKRAVETVAEATLRTEAV